VENTTTLGFKAGKTNNKQTKSQLIIVINFKFCVLKSTLLRYPEVGSSMVHINFGTCLARYNMSHRKRPNVNGEITTLTTSLIMAMQNKYAYEGSN
jgi:hypothetical protein